MQSAYAFKSDFKFAREAGASDYLTKPMNLKILKHTILKFVRWSNGKWCIIPLKAFHHKTIIAQH